jgi:hypothetical protein
LPLFLRKSYLVNLTETSAVKKLNGKGGKELETIGSVITLIGGILEFLLPLERLYSLAQNGGVGSFPVEETLLAILAVIGCVIIWKGYSIAGGVMGIVYRNPHPTVS